MTTTAPLDHGRRLGAPGDRPWTEAFSIASRVSGVMGLALDTAVRSSLLPELPALRDRERARLLHGTARGLCALHALRLRVTGALPAPPFVIVANHVSYLDPILLASLTPCTAIAKQEIGGWPIIGERARDLGVLLVDRRRPESGARVLRCALRALRRGVPVLNFPEGTTTRGQEVLPFRKGIFGVARIAGVPIVPAAITYDAPELCWAGDDTFLPHYLRFSSRREASACVTFGPPLGEHGGAAELAARARAVILDLLSL
ncbi:lysophospholipid acyltransferase family protein [Sorangium sp. So ce1151]|uniref:lysophospholipid acyltransferase family protein n=1 Tax=Sorangium sp. So ce1151 TaxID=3133332 RepID=UPI003F63E8AB